MSFSTGNFFVDLPESLPQELQETILSGKQFRLERIVSRGHASPVDFWYDQAEHEWVIVLRGEGVLRFADEPNPITLRPGEFVHIPAGCRHRVDATASESETVWLAIFYSD